MKEYKNDKGQYHRTDGPAIEHINGLRHREDGPAIEWSSGSKFWYLNGTEYSEEEYNQELIKLKLKRLIEL